MKTFKTVIQLVVISILLLPCLLIFNESEYYAFNVIGLLYSILIVCCIKHSNKFKSAKAYIKKVSEQEDKPIK